MTRLVLGVVLGVLFSCSPASVPPPPDLFNSTTPSRVVWPLGDSITYGVTGFNGNAGGYRPLGKAWFDSQGYAYSFTGTLTGPDGGLNDGHSGYTTANLLVVVQANLPGHITVPNLTFLLGSTNDIGQGIPNATAAANYRMILAYLQSKNYLMWIAVSTIPPFGFPSSSIVPDATVQDMNTRLVAEWDFYDANRPPNCPKLIRADIYTALSGNAAYFNGANVHPTTAGYAALWAEWQRALLASGVVH